MPALQPWKLSEMGSRASISLRLPGPRAGPSLNLSSYHNEWPAVATPGAGGIRVKEPDAVCSQFTVPMAGLGPGSGRRRMRNLGFEINWNLQVKSLMFPFYKKTRYLFAVVSSAPQFQASCVNDIFVCCFHLQVASDVESCARAH